VNHTGQATDAKAVQFLRELMPAAAQLALLVNPTNVPAGGIQARAAARELRWEFEIFEASTEDELDAAFEAMAKQKVGALDVSANAQNSSTRASSFCTMAASGRRRIGVRPHQDFQCWHVVSVSSGACLARFHGEFGG
jgi:hypothetical protein